MDQYRALLDETVLMYNAFCVVWVCELDHVISFFLLFIKYRARASMK